MKSADVLVSPLPASDMALRISNVTADKNGVATEDWTYPQNSKIAGDPSVPAGYLAAHESAIVADVAYDFKSPIRYVLRTIRFVRHAYIRPRLSHQVQNIRFRSSSGRGRDAPRASW